MPISCGEVAVVPGDIVVGDEEGVIVIPVHIPGFASVVPVDRLVYATLSRRVLSFDSDSQVVTRLNRMRP